MGWDSGWMPRAEPAIVSARVRTERDQTLRPRRPVAGQSTPITRRVPRNRRDQLRPAERSPAEEGLEHSNRRTWAGNEGLEHRVHRSAMLAENYVKSAAAPFPLGGLSEERIILTVRPGLEGDARKFLWPETLVKSDNDSIVTHSEAPCIAPCETLPADR